MRVFFNAIFSYEIYDSKKEQEMIVRMRRAQLFIHG